MRTKDFPPRPPHIADSFALSLWLDLLRSRQNIDDQIEVTSVASGDETYVFDVSANATLKATLENTLFGLTRFTVGSFTRDQSTASGNQAITGVGFSPKGVIFLAGETGTSKVSIGIDSQASRGAVFQNIPGGADFFNTDTVNSIYLTNAAGVSYSGKVTSLDSDGFTVAWTKSGAASGTATINYLAFR